MEQDRAPAVLAHLDELARPATESREVIVSTIAATTTRAGLTVHAELTPAATPGIKITDQQMGGLGQRALRRHDFHGNGTTRSFHSAPTARHNQRVIY
jgi:hypothetical protein